MPITSIQIVRIVQFCLSATATFLLFLQSNAGMMGYSFLSNPASFESKYYYTSLGIYLYATLLSSLSVIDCFCAIIDKVLVRVLNSGLKERIVAGVFLDIVLMFGWIASTSTIVTLSLLNSFYSLCYANRLNKTDGYSNCNESLVFVGISLVMNVICCITLVSSLLRGCRRWDGEEKMDDGGKVSWYDSEKATRK
jgi:hypothetical protein